MNINDFLYTKEAAAIFDHLKSEWNERERERYGYIIGNYCNEMALFHRIEKELAGAPLVVDFTNNKSKTNEKKNELTRARNESQQLLLKLANALKLTPASGGEIGVEDEELETPNAK